MNDDEARDLLRSKTTAELTELLVAKEAILMLVPYGLSERDTRKCERISSWIKSELVQRDKFDEKSNPALFATRINLLNPSQDDLDLLAEWLKEDEE
jgi:hypothetical protein